LRMLRHAALLGLLAVGLAGPVQADEADVVAVIYQAAERYGVSGARLLAVARCESTLNPWAVGRQGERGLFQLHPQGELRTFHARGYGDPFNAWEAADFAAARFAEGGSGAWSCAR
jgi:hypothetical protein